MSRRTAQTAQRALARKGNGNGCSEIEGSKSATHHRARRAACSRKLPAMGMGQGAREMRLRLQASAARRRLLATRLICGMQGLLLRRCSGLVQRQPPPQKLLQLTAMTRAV